MSYIYYIIVCNRKTQFAQLYSLQSDILRNGNNKNTGLVQIVPKIGKKFSEYELKIPCRVPFATGRHTFATTIHTIWRFSASSVSSAVSLPCSILSTQMEEPLG